MGGKWESLARSWEPVKRKKHEKNSNNSEAVRCNSGDIAAKASQATAEKIAR